jgi:hypothetical protein
MFHVRLRRYQRADGEEPHYEGDRRTGRGAIDMTRKIMALGPIAAGFAVVFASAISDAQAQQFESGPPIVRVEDCGKTAIFVCAGSGQRMGWPPQRMRAVPFRHVRHFQRSYDLPTREREWLWNDP